MSELTGADDVVTWLRLQGYALPADELAREIIDEAVKRWGVTRTIAGLKRHLSGPYPTYALEPVGAALGERFECPHQLLRLDG